MRQLINVPNSENEIFVVFYLKEVFGNQLFLTEKILSTKKIRKKSI